MTDNNFVKMVKGLNRKVFKVEEKLALMIESARENNERALAKLISHVEDRKPGWKDIMKTIYAETGRTCVIGITGSPGAGKSSLVGEFAKRLGDKGYNIGIIAVDPSSPFSGGAVLGDRIRMRDISTYQNIFIRSMATRGMLGGLCQAARDVVRIMGFAGRDIVIIETVGVGQGEIEVVSASDYVVLVTYPGGGDSVQAIKAGVMEIADLFVVNKADLPGADQVVADIEAMLDLCSTADRARPPVLKATATQNTGIRDLVAAVRSMLARPCDEDSRQKIRVKEELVRLLAAEVARLVHDKWNRDGSLSSAVEDVLSLKNDPYSIVQEVLAPVACHLK